jgi:hypothetical protein
VIPYPDDDPPPKCERHPSTYLYTEECGWCGGEGTTYPGELYDEDPLWYDEDDVETCHSCQGRGWFRECPRCIDGKPESVRNQPAPRSGT